VTCRRSERRDIKAAGSPAKWLQDFDVDANPTINPATVNNLATPAKGSAKQAALT